LQLAYAGQDKPESALAANEEAAACEEDAVTGGAISLRLEKQRMDLMRAISMSSLTIAALFALCGNAFAWGDTGHKVVCDLAFRLAAPDTRAEIRRLIRLDSEFDFFADSCTWPDHPRKRASEHFINLKRDATGIPPDDECPTSDACVLSAIEKDSKTLGSSTDDDEKLDALKFLGHWVGDIHQPLHVSFEDDRGGNNIHVTGECSPNLHSAWDNCLVFRAVGEKVTTASRQLFNSLTPTKKEQWAATDPRDWANESFALAEAARSVTATATGPHAICLHRHASKLMQGTSTQM